MGQPTNAEFVSALRELADFYEARPDLITPWDPEFTLLPHGKEGMAQAARLLGACKKEVDGTFFRLKRFVGAIKINALEYRTVVCERVVLGRKAVPETYVPARKAQLIAAHEEDIIEYRCSVSLLAPSAAD